MLNLITITTFSAILEFAFESDSMSSKITWFKRSSIYEFMHGSK